MQQDILKLSTIPEYLTRNDLSEKWIITYSIPDWGVEEIRAFSNILKPCISEAVHRRIWQAASCLLNIADSDGNKAYAEISKNNLIAAKNHLDIMIQPWLYRVLLWLVVIKKVSLTIVSNCYFDDSKQRKIKELVDKYDEKTIALDLLDLSFTKNPILRPPVWCSFDYKRFCENITPDNYWQKQKAMGLIQMRWFDRRYNLRSLNNLSPSMIAAYLEYWKQVSNDTQLYLGFMQFLCNENIIPAFLLKASYKHNYKKVVIKKQYFQDSKCECTALMLYNMGKKVCETMAKLGYTSTPIKNAKSAITNLSLNLYENNINFSLDYAMSWCASQPVSWDRCSYPIGLFIASKLLTKQEITADSLYEDHYLPRLIKRKAIPEWAASTVDEYLKWESALGKGKKTIDCKRYAISRFVQYMQTHVCRTFSSLNAKLINDFVMWDYHATPAGKSCYNLKIRGFLFYLAEKGLINYQIAFAMPGSCEKSSKPIKILNEKQREEIRSFCSEAVSEKETRVKLTLLLALRMGLRAVDITNLKLSNININTGELEFVQHKNKRRLKLPIPDEVFAGLYQYLMRTSRKNLSNNNIMLSSKAPHHKMKTAGVIDTFNKFKCEHFSMHDCRRTLASDLLNAGVDMWTIVETLGHSDLETIHLYFSCNTEMLRECCLPLDCFAMSEEVWS